MLVVRHIFILLIILFYDVNLLSFYCPKARSFIELFGNSTMRTPWGYFNRNTSWILVRYFSSWADQSVRTLHNNWQVKWINRLYILESMCECCEICRTNPSSFDKNIYNYLTENLSFNNSSLVKTKWMKKKMKCHNNFTINSALVQVWFASSKMLFYTLYNTFYNSSLNSP